MPSPSLIPSACVQDAVAQLSPDGSLQPVSLAMQDWSSRFGTALADLPLDDDERAELAAGEPVMMLSDGEAWELRCHEADGGRWLLARDVTDREHRLATTLASMRCRALGQMASSLSHDLNNQFNAVLALSAQLGFYAQTDADRESLHELEQGTKVGARMAGVLARILMRTPARRERVAAAGLVEDALAVVRKTFEHAGIPLDVAVPERLPDVRVAQLEVVQAVMEGLHVLIELGPTGLRFSVEERELAWPDGRARACVVARCEAGGVGRERAEQVVQVAQLRPGTVAQIAKGAGGYDAILTAAFLQRRLGGDLRAELEDQQLSLEFYWPRAR